METKLNINETRRAIAALNDKHLDEVLQLTDAQLARLKELLAG